MLEPVTAERQMVEMPLSRPAVGRAAVPTTPAAPTVVEVPPVLAVPPTPAAESEPAPLPPGRHRAPSSRPRGQVARIVRGLLR